MPRGVALSADLRWRVIWLRTIDGWSVKRIAKRMRISDDLKSGMRSVARYLAIFKRHGEVEKPKADAPACGLSEEVAAQLMELIIDTPEGTMLEHFEVLCRQHGLAIHYSTVCKAAHALGFSRKRLRGFAVNRSEQAARRFKRLIQTYDAKQLFFLDETAKDPRDLNRGWGWSILGRKPLHSEGFIGRGTRRSTLAGLDVKGFVNWFTVTGTFNRQRFLDAMRRVVVCMQANHYRLLTRRTHRFVYAGTAHDTVSRPTLGHHSGQCSDSPLPGAQRHDLPSWWDPAVHASILLRLHAAGQWCIWMDQALPPEELEPAGSPAAGEGSG